MLRYLFGPISAAFAQTQLADQIVSGDCIAFNQLEDGLLSINPDDDWEAVLRKLPSGWVPDAVVLWASHATTIPETIRFAPLPVIYFAFDWRHQFHRYRLQLPFCEVAFTDSRGADIFREIGVPDVRPFIYSDFHPNPSEHSQLNVTRDIDLLFQAPLRPDVDRERLPWVARLAALGRTRNVIIQGTGEEESDFDILRRTKISFQKTLTGESNARSFAAMAQGALLFQDDDNRDLAASFVAGQECIFYNSHSFTRLVEHYLAQDDERNAIASAGQLKTQDFTFARVWRSALAELRDEWPLIMTRRRNRPSPDSDWALRARVWDSLGSRHIVDPFLGRDLEASIDVAVDKVDLTIALGLIPMLRNGNNVRNLTAENFDQAEGVLRRAIAQDPSNPMGILNLAELLLCRGRREETEQLAKNALMQLSRYRASAASCLLAPHFPPALDYFRARWEKAAWDSSVDEFDDKLHLIRARWHMILAAVTKDASHYFEAALTLSDLATVRTAIGCHHGTSGRPNDAISHLQHALHNNPMDATAARALHQAYMEVGDLSAAREVANSRQVLSRAAPTLVNIEPWFAPLDSEFQSQPQDFRPPRCRLSLCMIVKNEENNLHDCLRSVADLVNDIIVVDTGSTDRTREIAASFGAKVVDFPWVDSFSAARNESLRHADGEWVFWMDADDRLDEPNRGRLKALIETLGQENLAFVMKCRCLSAAGDHAQTIVDHIRLFRHHDGLRWEHRIHEQILPSLRRHGAQIQWTDVVVTHTGYAEGSIVKRKQERDLRLLLIEREELEDHPFTLFNLGSTYLELGLCKTALPLLLQSLERSSPADSITRKLYVLVSESHRRLGQLDDALQVCTAGRRHYPKNAEILFQEARVREGRGDLQGARSCIEILLREPESRHFASVAEGLAGPQSRHYLAQLWAKDGNDREAERVLREAISNSPRWTLLWVELAQIMLSRRDWSAFGRVCDQMNDTLGRTIESEVLQARAALAQGHFFASITRLTSVIEAHPNSVWPRIILSHALLQEGRDLPAAEQALLAVMALDPSNREAARNLQILRANSSHFQRDT